MFNGIIYNLGIVKTIKKKNSDCYIEILSNMNVKKKEIGSSIACNGVCLTLTGYKKKKLLFYLSKETLNKSNFNSVKLGDKINLEKSMIYGQNISGHFVQGHVDIRGKLKKILKRSNSWEITIEIPNNFTKYLLEKGSVTINGVSLTISKTFRNNFYLTIIPHTLKLTNLIDLKINDKVNVELDMVSKYLINLNT